MGRTIVKKIVLETCEVLWNKLSETYVSTPNEAEYSQIADEFFQQWNMPNCLGALDGKHINIQGPPNSHTMFFSYKKTFSEVLLATCDANYIFTNVSIGAMEVNIFMNYNKSMFIALYFSGICSESQFGKHILNKCTS